MSRTRPRAPVGEAFRPSSVRITRNSEIAEAHGNHMSEKSAYPANLCPLSSGVEFADLGEDLGQSVGEPIEAASRKAFREG